MNAVQFVILHFCLQQSAASPSDFSHLDESTGMFSSHFVEGFLFFFGGGEISTARQASE